ncbi:MAG: DUF760 domain-containing protein [Cyanobacteria bacterium P01_H01_bin.15]
MTNLFGSAPGEQNPLQDYVQSLAPETIAQLSKPESPEVFRIIEQNISGMLGHLPMEQFPMEVTTTRENLGRLLASAMMGGYFLRNAEQRLSFERSLAGLVESSEASEAVDDLT